MLSTAEYRLAPEHSDLTPVEDCYAALQRVAANASNLGIDLTRFVLLGGSAGGGLAAGTAFIAQSARPGRS